MLTTQVKKVLAAMPGSLPELVDRTGYPVPHVLAFIAQARIAGEKISVLQEAGVTVFTHEPKP